MSYKEEDIIKLLNQKQLSDKILGIGDDCAVIPKDFNSSWLISVDALVEDVHFTLSSIDPYALGVKSIKVNVSDIVAMGGKPRFVLLSCAIPCYLNDSFIKTYIKGINNTVSSYNIHVIGGDSVASKSKFFISITIIGEAQNNAIKYRNNAKIGDIICITGKPGLSAMGLKILTECAVKKNDINKKRLIKKHISPYIYSKEAMFLAKYKKVHAMIDCSDGLDKDLGRLCVASKCSADIAIESIPVDKILRLISEKNGWNINEFILAGGEDYILLFTVSPEIIEDLEDSYMLKFKKRFYKIGNISNRKRYSIFYSMHGKPFKNVYKNFEHFSLCKNIK